MRVVIFECRNFRSFFVNGLDYVFWGRSECIGKNIGFCVREVG